MPMASILVVEDEDEIRVMFQSVLQAAGYHVDSVRTATAARACLQMRGYDLVLTDLRLGPGGDGLTIAAAAAERGVAALIVTGNAPSLSNDDRRRHEVLEKPLQIDDLLEAVGRRIGASSSD